MTGYRTVAELLAAGVEAVEDGKSILRYGAELAAPPVVKWDSRVIRVRDGRAAQTVLMRARRQLQLVPEYFFLAR